jgi:hypothetical protein
MHPKSSRDMPGPDPRKDTDRETREAVVKTPDKTNDWDRDQVHREGETIGIEPDRDDNLATVQTNTGIEMDGEIVEEDDDNAQARYPFPAPLVGNNLLDDRQVDDAEISRLATQLFLEAEAEGTGDEELSDSFVDVHKGLAAFIRRRHRAPTLKQ